MKDEKLDIKNSDLDSARLDECILSLTSQCNLRCVYCASVQPGYKIMQLDMGVFEGLIDEFRLFGLNIIFASGHGETTIIPDWHKFIRKIVGREFGLGITSNFARTFDEEEVDLLARMDSVVISIDTVDRELLMKIRQSVSLETILDNMAKIRKRAGELGRKTHFAWQNTLSDLVVSNLKEYVESGLKADVRRFYFNNLIEHEPVSGMLHAHHPSTLPIEQLISFLQSLHEIMNVIRDNGGVLLVQPGLFERINASLAAAGLPPVKLGEYYNHRVPNGSSTQQASMISAKTAANEHAAVNVIDGLETRYCVDPWSNPYIQSNGDVWPCCWFHDSIGNIYEEKFLNIWDGNTIRKLRRELLSGNLRKQCLECPCRSRSNTHNLLRRVRNLPLSNIKLSAQKKRKWFIFSKAVPL